MINGYNSMVPLAHVHVRDRDYSAYISLCSETHNIHIFKYNDTCCDYEVFGGNQSELAQIFLDSYLGG